MARLDKAPFSFLLDGAFFLAALKGIHLICLFSRTRHVVDKYVDGLWEFAGSLENPLPTLAEKLMERFRLWRAETLLTQGRYVSASRFLAKISTGHCRSLRLKGRLLGRAGLPVAAVACFRQAIRAPGATMEDVLELSFGLVKVRDFEAAEGVLTSYLRKSPDDLRAQRLLAHIFRAQGRFATALRTLQAMRPGKVAAKYANLMPPVPRLGWCPQKAWQQALLQAGKDVHRWSNPAAMASDQQGRDRLLCFFDELAGKKGGRKALAYGVAQALTSGESWLLPWVRKSAVYLKLDMPKSLPSFLARYGSREDKHILLAALTVGRFEREQAAIALISLGYPEYVEVLEEMRLCKSATGASGSTAIDLEGHAIIQSSK